MNNIDNNNK